MKKTYLVLLLTLVALTINAIPAKRNIWKTVTLANGSKVSVQLRGDEYLHYWQDAQGMVYEVKIPDFSNPLIFHRVPMPPKSAVRMFVEYNKVDDLP